MRGVALGIVGLIAVIFAFSGAGTLTLSRAGSAEVASVGDYSITEQDVAFKLEELKTRILRENDGLSDDQLDDDILRPIAIQQLIGSKALFNHAINGSMAASPKTLADLIVNAAIFQTDGKFDEDRYRYFIRNRGFTNAGYKQSLTEEITRLQLLNGLRYSSFVTPKEIDRMASFFGQSRDYYYLKFPLEVIEKLVDPLEAELSEYYENNKRKKRWVIYSSEIDATKIPVEWYSWMHFTPNRIEKKHDLEKYDWQKPHQSNQTGTENSYHPNKENNEIKKKYKTWNS